MQAELLTLLPFDRLEPLLAGAGGEVLLLGLVFLATASLVGIGVPGVLIPMALSSGALFGAWEAAAAVALGSVAGSQLFFLAARRLTGQRIRDRLGARLESFQRSFAARGIWYVIGLRLVGAPHLLVTAGSAMMAMRSTSFAAATLIGVLPAIAIAAATGSAI